MTAAIDFEALYADADPFRYRTLWYEERKRALLLAMLPARRYARGWEWGCSNGELTAALAERCDTLLATDIAPRAITLARERLADVGHVDLRCMAHPAHWPEGRFDLVVFSEVGYYLPAADFDIALARFAAMRDNATLVACHWRPAFAAAQRSGDAVHTALERHLGAPALRYVDDDVRLDAWQPGSGSLAQREGLRCSPSWFRRTTRRPASAPASRRSPPPPRTLRWVAKTWWWWWRWIDARTPPGISRAPPVR